MQIKKKITLAIKRIHFLLAQMLIIHSRDQSYSSTKTRVAVVIVLQTNNIKEDLVRISINNNNNIIIKIVNKTKAGSNRTLIDLSSLYIMIARTQKNYHS
jgi:hypothetical protein